MKLFLIEEQAKHKVKLGLDKVANAVKLSLGHSGRNAIIGRPYQAPLITNDGITIAREIELEDEIEQIGKEALDEALKSANDEAGDGTTTTTVLLQAITDEAFKRLEPKGKLVKEVTDPMVIRKEINEATQKALEILKTKARLIETLEDIENVATISVENKDLGKKIAKMFHELGKDAVIQTMDSHGFDVEFETIKGLEINAGLPSYHFINDKTQYKCENPYILVTNHTIQHDSQLESVISEALTKKRPIVILAEHISKGMIDLFAEEFETINIIPVKCPIFNDNEILKDYASILGAKFYDTFDDLKNFTLKDFGTCDQFIMGKDKTKLIESHGDTTKRIEEVKGQLKDVDTLFDKEQLKKRIGRLQGGMGAIKVGAMTGTDREYLKLKLEDAVNATRHAMAEGVVKGGGLALMEVADELGDTIITKALRTPYEQIQKNSGGCEVGDNVIDPVKVTRTALEKASSVAGLFITIEIAIADKREPKKDKTIDET